MPVNLEELPQLSAVVTASEAVGTQSIVRPIDKRSDLIGEGFYVIASGYSRPAVICQAVCDIAAAGRRLRME